MVAAYQGRAQRLRLLSAWLKLRHTRKNRRIIVKVDIEVANKAIYWRGLFITRYAAFEFAIAELVSRAFLHQAYKHLGHPPFGPVKKFRRLNQFIGLPGPIANYRSDLQVRLDDFALYGDHRGFMAHAIMVPRSSKDIAFKMYDHCEGVYSVGELQFEMEHLEKLATSIRDISINFTSMVGKICDDTFGRMLASFIRIAAVQTRVTQGFIACFDPL